MPLRIAISAQIQSWRPGGEATVLLALIRALGQLRDGDEEYVIIASPGSEAVLHENLGPNQQVVVRQRSRRQDLSPRQQLRRLRIWFGRMAAPPVWPEVPLSDGFYESLGCDLIHWAHPYFEVSSLPSIFQLYDLQHLHYPEYFIPEEIAVRENRFPLACRISQAVVTGSQWSKQDIHRSYGTPLDKIYPIWGGPPTELYSGEATSAEVLLRKYGLKTSFMLYPAAVLPHKNHLRLLEALAHLRDDHDLRLNLVCTGNDQKPHFTRVKQQVEKLGLGDQVRLLGLVPQEDLRGLYGLCEFVVFPSLFEGAGYPPLEAFHAGKAVACSDATSLPEVVGEAALSFDATRTGDIAEALRSLSNDKNLRDTLARRGQERLAQFSWESSARHYRALYRRVGRISLDAGDSARLDFSETL